MDKGLYAAICFFLGLVFAIMYTVVIDELIADSVTNSLVLGAYNVTDLAVCG